MAIPSKKTNVFAAMARFVGLQTEQIKPGLQLTESQREMLSQFGPDFMARIEEIIKPEAEEQASGQSIDIESNLSKMMLDYVRDITTRATTIQAVNDELRVQLEKLSAEETPEVEATLSGKGNDSSPNFGLAARSMKIDAGHKHNVFANDFVRTGVRMVASDSTMDVGQLKQEFGKLVDSRQAMNIILPIFQDLQVKKYMTVVYTDTEYRATGAHVTSVVSQFTPMWNPAGKTKYTPISIPQRRHKINVAIVPAEVIDTWLGELYDQSKSPDQMPITRYIVENLIKPQIIQDIELRMIAKGKYDPSAIAALKPNDPGVPAEKGMDGFETILVDAKAKKGTANDTGIKFFEVDFDFKNCTDDAILKHVQDFISVISPLYRGVNMPVFCSRDFYKRYKLAYKRVWSEGSGNADPRFGGDVIDYSNNTLVPLDSMYGSPILFATTTNNFKMLRSTNDASNIINDVQKHDYEVRIYGEFCLATGFAIGEAVFAFVPDGYNPNNVISQTYGESTDYGVPSPKVVVEEGA